MARNRFGRRRVGAVMVLAGLFGSMVAVLAPSLASADPLPPGTLGLFENEGDQDDATLNTGNIDWETVKTDPRITQWALIHDDGDEDTTDATFLDSAKEQDPSTWGCAANESPPKDDIFRLYLASRITADDQFLHIGYVREKATGDTDINLEFNQASGDFECPDNEGRERSRDDLMISFTFSGGNDPSEINVYRWDPTAASDGPGDPDPSDTGSDFVAGDGHWDLVSLSAGSAAGADNAAFDDPLITDQFFDDGELEPRAFGEITLDLSELFEEGLLGCPGFGFVNGHSRASHSFASDLKDVFPETLFDLSDCAKIKIKKVDNSVPPVATAGAVYGLYDSQAKAQAVVDGQSDAAAKAAAVSWCTTGADGTCLLTDVDPDKDYWITEISPPAGLLPSTEIRAVDADDIDPFDLVDLTGTPFVNNVPVGNVTITKRLFEDDNHNGDLDPGEQVTPDQLSDLDGIKFELQQAGVTAKTHPANANAECTIAGGTGQCTISSVKLGAYDIKETLNPNGPSGVGVGDSPSVTITTNGQTVTANYDNPLSPINVALDKSGPDTAEVGDQITYTFKVSTTGVPLTITQLNEVIDAANNFDDRCDAATPLTGPDKSTTVDPQNDSDDKLEVDETWQWTCKHIVTLADATDGDGTDLLNKAHVDGKDDVGRTVFAEDTHKVVIELPDLEVTKLAADGVDEDTEDSGGETVDAPGTASYTVVVKNVGDGVAQNATLTDTLPAGSWTVTLDSPDGDDSCPVGGNPKSGSFTCTFGDLDPTAGKTITVSRAVTLDDCDGAAALENNADVTTTHDGGDLDLNSTNDHAEATVSIRCPDAGVVKEAVEPVVDAFGRAEWTITVTNHGAGDAKDVHIVDDLPSGLTDWQVTGTDADPCAIVLGTLACNFGTLHGGDVRTITISGLTDPFDCGIVENTVDLVDGEANDYEDTNDENDSSSDSLDVRCPIEIDLDKTGDTIAHVGDTVDYEFTVTNIGGEDLVNVELTDPECNEGTIVLVDDGDGDSENVLAKGTWDGDSFEGGEVWGYTCQRTITAEDVVVVDGQDFALNTGTVTAEDADERPVEATDPHEVLIITPDIDIVKTVDDDTPLVGQTVTFTYVVTNTGNTTLFGIDVVDDQLGPIGTIDELAPGESATLTKTMVVAASSPTRNVATADGEDVLGKHVDDDDDAEITIVEAEVIVPPQTLPATGSDIDRMLVMAGLLLLVGGALINFSGLAAAGARRKRRE